ncbi:MAG: hypothetical protein IJ728_03145 [Selenomonadaceae bacterium]|nr:hypothetical protein [Selenomonadaceae bacterium]
METTLSNSLQTFTNEEINANVRVISQDGETYFVAVDVCKALDLTNPTMAIDRLDEDERAKLNLGRQGETNCVNESGLYNLILGSRKPEAKAFKRWITHEVLPSIRKTGFYSADQFSTKPNENFTIYDLRCYIDENGTAFFNLRDIAFALGITQTQNGKEFVRWYSIRKKLRQINDYQTFGKTFNKATFIPESVFYALAMQTARTEKAINFQKFFTEKIMPEIRKNSSYRQSNEIDQPVQSKTPKIKNISLVKLVKEVFKLADIIQKKRHISEDEALIAAIEIKEMQSDSEFPFLRRLLN